MAIGFCIFSLLIIVMELLTGCALVGWSGDNVVVEREKAPGPYWFTVALHSFAGLAVPLVIVCGQ